MNIFIHSFIPAPVNYHKEGRKEYEKRLSRYCKCKHTIYKNEKQQQKALDKLLQIPFSAGKDVAIFVNSGDAESNIDSPLLASFIEEKGIFGVSNLHFYIGFQQVMDALSETDRAKLSFETFSISNMTIASDLLSLVLEEQIYRAYRIINKEPYHK